MELIYTYIFSSVFTIVTLTFAVYLLRQNPKNTLNRLLFLICICFIERNTTTQLLFSSLLDYDKIAILFKLNSFVTHVLFALYLHFFIYFKEKKKLEAWKLVIIYLPSILITLIPVITNENYAERRFINGDWNIGKSNDSLWLYISVIYIILYSAITIYQVFLYWKHAQLKREKRQAVVLIANILLLAITNNLFLPFRVLANMVYVYLIGINYALFRFRFLSVKLSLVAEDIVSHISDIVILLDRQHKIVMANSTATDFFQTTQETLKDSDFSGMIRSDHNIEKILADFMNGDENSFKTMLAYRKDDETIMTDTFFSKVKDKFTDIVGILVISREIMGRKDFQKNYNITRREMEIADLILAGLPNKSIGEKLQISERTVETHCIHIFNKLGITSKTDFIRFATKFSLLN